MMVREKRAAPAHKGQAAAEARPAQGHTFQAPLAGLVIGGSTLNPVPGSARILDNWICTTIGVRARGGAVKHATVDAPVESLFTYKSGNTEKMFAATETDVYDITTPADPDVAPTADISGQTAGYYSTQQFGTAGGDYLYAVNAADDAQLFNGTSWQAVNSGSSPIAITGVSTSDLSAVWSHAKRLWFVEQYSMSAWYLPVNSIGGAATEFSLAGVFRRGGSLLFGTSWSVDAGDGLDDKCIFVSTEGEIAVYSGSDPSSASTWALQGVYDLPEPLGVNSFARAGGDVLIATKVGLIPVSAGIQRDIAALSGVAVSKNIAPLWQDRAQAIVNKNWEMVKIPSSNILVVSQPDASSTDGTALCVNLQTGAWSRFTGWDTQCLAVFNNYGYFGDGTDAVFLMDSGGSDNGSPYTCAYLGQFESLGIPGNEKTALQVRPNFQAASPIIAKASIHADYDETLPSAPSSPANYTADVWDSGLWDTAIWDATDSYAQKSYWRGAAASGSMLAPALQLTFGVTPTPLVEFSSMDIQFSVGAVVT